MSLIGAATIAAGVALGGGAAAQSQRPVVVPIEYPDEFHVYFVNGECTQTLIVPSAPHRAELKRFNISYRRSEGCLWWPLDREMEGLRTLMAVLLKELPDRDRVTGFFLGRVMQPEFRLRIANASLRADLSTLPSQRLARPLRAAVESADVFKELRELFAANGFRLTLRSLEKIERARVVELAQWAVDHKDLAMPPPENARLPLAAIVWFEVEPR
ncbi:MAG: hypothetical protein JNK67_09865 [Alphaproteobacteria bacterium]|nr:hypothetical protein [Alphaproteobacteria bacterium]